MIKKLSLASLVILTALMMTTPVYAYSNSISVQPPIVPKGTTTTITLETVDRATGIIKVQDPNGDWHEAKEPMDIPTGGGQQTWVYPNDFKDGDTQTPGPYKVVAEVTFPDVTWISQFQVGFFATVPEVPLGTIVVAFATFGALGVFTLRKRFFPRMRF